MVAGQPIRSTEAGAVSGVGKASPPDIDQLAPAPPAYGRRVPDAIFSDPRLARLYDPLDPDRSDLDAYCRLVDELGARSVLDVGCGTGTFACLLAGRGLDVVGVDPASASLDIARSKLGSDSVTWVHGDATTLPHLAVDLVTMTANAAQVFLDDADFHATLVAARNACRVGGIVAFEVRDPRREAWRSWTPEDSFTRTEVPGIGVVESWVELTSQDLPFVSFRWSYRFDDTGEVVTSDSILRFRDEEEVRACVVRAGMDVREVRDAPDRPGMELVFLCAAGPPEPEPRRALGTTPGRRVPGPATPTGGPRGGGRSRRP